MTKDIVKEIFELELKDCCGCIHHNIKSRDNPLNPMSDIMLPIGTVRKHGTCITGIEWCSKYNVKLERISGGFSASYRCKKCIKEFTLYDMPNDYKVKE